MKSPVNICWFRRDLRLEDNAALYHALKDKNPVVPVFIFDRQILDELEDRTDRRVEFIREAILAMQEKLEKKESTMDVRYGSPEEVFAELVKDYQIEKVFTNSDYEPYARERDQQIANLLRENGVSFHSYKDQVIFEKTEVLKDDGTPYTVFTPYSRKWKSLVNEFYLKSYPCKKYYRNFFKHSPKRIPSLAAMDFKAAGKAFPPAKWKPAVVKEYNKHRDFPGIEGTTHLGLHLRFGTISVRELAREAGALNETFLGELIWRDFFQTILWHFPKVVTPGI
jgi:deoxyribodipyrimidine photo-lyase